LLLLILLTGSTYLHFFSIRSPIVFVQPNKLSNAFLSCSFCFGSHPLGLCRQHPRNGWRK
jgi:hypothetical protein